MWVAASVGDPIFPQPTPSQVLQTLWMCLTDFLGCPGALSYSSCGLRPWERHTLGKDC